MQQLLLAHGADAAGDALAARLVAEELGDAPQDLAQVDGVVERHHHGRAEGGADGARPLEGERDVELVRGHEGAGRAAQQDGLEATAPADAAGQLEQLAAG